jgi:hypothetical protein
MPRAFSPEEIRSARPITGPVPQEPAWFASLTRRRAMGFLLLTLAALSGPAVFGIAAVEQTLLAQAVATIETDPSCSQPIWQRMYGGRCLTSPAPVRQKFVDGAGWNAVYHVVIGVRDGSTEDITFLHAPTLYRRIAAGRPIMVRTFQGVPITLGIGNLAAAAGYGPLLDSRRTWALVRYVGVTMTLFEMLAVVLYFTVKHVRRGALPKGQDGLWI